VCVSGLCASQEEVVTLGESSDEGFMCATAPDVAAKRACCQTALDGWLSSRPGFKSVKEAETALVAAGDDDSGKAGRRVAAARHRYETSLLKHLAAKAKKRCVSSQFVFHPPVAPEATEARIKAEAGLSEAENNLKAANTEVTSATAALTAAQHMAASVDPGSGVFAAEQALTKATADVKTANDKHGAAVVALDGAKLSWQSASDAFVGTEATHTDAAAALTKLEDAHAVRQEEFDKQVTGLTEDHAAKDKAAADAADEVAAKQKVATDATDASAPQDEIDAAEGEVATAQTAADSATANSDAAAKLLKDKNDEYEAYNTGAEAEIKTASDLATATKVALDAAQDTLDGATAHKESAAVAVEEAAAEVEHAVQVEGETHAMVQSLQDTGSQAAVSGPVLQAKVKAAQKRLEAALDGKSEAQQGLLDANTLVKHTSGAEEVALSRHGALVASPDIKQWEAKMDAEKKRSASVSQSFADFKNCIVADKWICG